MSNKFKLIIGFLVIALIFLLYNSMYVVSVKQQAVVFQFGNPVRVAKDPGLYFKTPFIQSVKMFDKRILEWDGDNSEIPVEGKKISVEAFARWRISDPQIFYTRVINESGAQTRLDDIINGVVRDEITGTNNLQLVIADTKTLGENKGRTKLVNDIRANVQKRLNESDIGVEFLDFQIKRINYTAKVRKTVFAEIRASQDKIAKEYRSEGDKLALIIESEAYRRTKEIKARAEAKVKRIKGKAFSKDADFYNFTKSLEALEASVDKNTKIVITEESDFFRFLKSK